MTSLFISPKNFFFPAENQDQQETQSLYKKRYFQNNLKIYRIYGDIFLPSEKTQFIYPILLLKKIKYLKELHIRKNGIILEYENLDKNFLPDIQFFTNEKLNIYENCNENQKYDARFSQIKIDLIENLKNLENYNLNLNFNNEKIIFQSNYKHIIHIFDEIFHEFYLQKFLFLAYEIINQNDFSLKFFAINKNFLNYITLDKNQDFLDINFIEICEKIFVYQNLNDYFSNLNQFFYRIMQKKEKINEEIDILINTVLGIHKIKVKIFENALKKEKLLIFGLVVLNTSEEIIFYNKLIEFKTKKKIQNKFEEKFFSDHSKLLSLYYKEKKN